MKLPVGGPKYWGKSNGNGPRHLLTDDRQATLCKRTRFSVHQGFGAGPFCAPCLAAWARLPDPAEPKRELQHRRDSGVGAWLRQLRRQAALSQVEVARRMGCQPSWISHLESGRLDPRMSTVLRYGEAIGARIHIGLADQAHTDTTKEGS